MAFKNAKLFSDYYDSINQRLHWEYLDQNDKSKYLFVGRMRFDTLVSRKLVLIDTQLLDGAIFLSVPPEELLPNLRRLNLDRAPLEVRSRTTNLKESLLKFVVSPDGSSTKRFSFSGIKDTAQRKRVEEGLLNYPLSQLNNWQDITGAMEHFGVSQENIGLFEMSWSKWLEAQQNGLLEVQMWGGKFDAYRDIALGNEEDIVSQAKTTDGKEMASWVYENRLDRSLIDVEINSVKGTWANKELLDLRYIETWYHRAYDLAAAWQNSCEIIESTFDSALEILDPSEFAPDKPDDKSGTSKMNRAKLDLDVDFIQALGKIPPQEYQSIYSDTEAHFESWWNNEDFDSLRRGLEPFAEAIIKKRYGELKHDTKDVIRIAAPALIELLALENFNNPALAAIIGAMGLLTGVAIHFFDIDKEAPQKVLVQRLIDVVLEQRRKENEQN